MQPYQVPYDYFSAGVSCAQCSVHIPNPWFDKLNRKPNIEQQQLQKRADANSSFSRLACCVQVRPELNEMVCVVGQNRSVNSEWFNGDDPNAF